MDRILAPRVVFAVIFAVCIGLIAYALYLQHAQALEPCPMCILQRYAFIAIGVIALIAAAHGPGRRGITFYSGSIALFSVVGSGVAIRHSWLQRFPDPLQSCGADLGYLLELPLSRGLPAIFRGTGECSEVQWRFLGLSIPEWALVWFVFFLALAITLIVRVRHAR